MFPWLTKQSSFVGRIKNEEDITFLGQSQNPFHIKMVIIVDETDVALQVVAGQVMEITQSN